MGVRSRGGSATVLSLVLAGSACSASDDAAPPAVASGARGGTSASGGSGATGAVGAGGGDGGSSGTGAVVDASGAASGTGGSAGTIASDAGTETGPDVALGCLERLRGRGVVYQRVEAKGVVDAVELDGRLNGVLIANGTSQNPTRDPMACEFVETLHAFTGLLEERGFDRIGTLGSYCYRCCCAWSETNFCRGPEDPEPECGSSGFSNHSWGRAIDVRYLYKSDGTVYDVDDPAHFVEWSGPSETCGAALAAQSGVSRELYQLVCEASARRLFSTVLTPNYNDAHRNHFHLDIGESGAPSGFVVRSELWPGVDSALHGDD
jgi:hypothetical protein